jgi:hypothetical protein
MTRTVAMRKLTRLFCKLSRREQIRGTLDLPPALKVVEAKVASLAFLTDSVLREISTLLCKSLDPPLSTVVIDDETTPGLSNMCLGLATAPAGTPLMDSHLDEDLLTMTFYDEPFLEVLDREAAEWKLVEVLEDLPIVNVGASFQAISDNRLYAPFHRVRQCQRHINLIMYDLCPGLQEKSLVTST